MTSSISVASLTPQISVLTLNRPEKRNALDIELLKAFLEALHNIEQIHTKRILIIQGAGTVFCAGMDLYEASQPSLSTISGEIIAQSLTALYRSPLITIAAIHGAAIGGGAGLMSACDLAIAAEGTQIGYPEVRRGLVAAQVMIFLLRQLKQKNLKELLLTGELIQPEQAQAIGLINRIVPLDNLLEEALKMTKSILKGAPKAIKKTKALIESLYPGVFEDDLAKLLKDHHEMRSSAEAVEGMKAFLEKREPEWQ